MPKMKTRKSAKKKYKVTAHGKIKYKQQGLGHLLTKKKSKRKRRLGKPTILSSVETKRAKKLLPYS